VTTGIEAIARNEDKSPHHFLNQHPPELKPNLSTTFKCAGKQRHRLAACTCGGDRITAIRVFGKNMGNKVL
jgi:hypothetical protein